MSQETIIYTDGASSGNPGPGGYAAVVAESGRVIEIGGGEDNTTNNRMEMRAVNAALEKIAAGMSATIYTDSSYVINGITKWVFGWQKNNWQTKDKKEVLNRDLWEAMHDLVSARKIKFVRVRGHAGFAVNNRVDEIAVAFSKKTDVTLFNGPAEKYFTKVAAPTAAELESASEKKYVDDRKKQKAFSYLSMLDGKIEKHVTWAECEARIKGKPNAKFRKSVSAEDESAIIASWQA